MSNEIVRVTEAYTAFKANVEPYGFCGFEAFKAGVEWQRSQGQAELAATVKDSLTVGKAQMARDSAELRRLCAERDKLKAKAAVPDGWKLVKVGVEGVQFGNAWHSHEKITGYSADQLNAGHCGIAGRAYMEWLAAATAQPQSDGVLMPKELLYRTIRALDTGDADPTQEESELRALLGGDHDPAL